MRVNSTRSPDLPRVTQTKKGLSLSPSVPEGVFVFNPCTYDPALYEMQRAAYGWTEKAEFNYASYVRGDTGATWWDMIYILAYFLIPVVSGFSPHRKNAKVETQPKQNNATSHRHRSCGNHRLGV